MSHKPLVFLLFLMMLLPTLMVFSEDVAATQVDATNLGDAKVRASQPTTNYGSDTFMNCGATDYLGIYLKFNVSGISSGSTVSSALLKLYKYGGATTITLNVYRVTSSWVESDITYNTVPTVDSTPVADFTLTGGVANYYTVNITTLVGQWVSGTYTNYGIKISNSSAPASCIFYTKENADSRPILNITYVSVIAPVAAFSANHLTGNPGTSVTFTDASTNTPTNWTWVFGDGSATNYTQSPVHTYALPGTYNVSLRAYNSAGADYENKTGYITITGWMPTLTNVPTLTGRKGVNWSWVPTWNESVTSSLYINPPFMNYTNGTIWGVPVDNNTIYAFELNATSVNGTLVRHTFWNITIGSDWSSTFTSTPSTPVHAATTYSYQVLLNESATVTFLFKPAWLNVTHNGTTGNHYINGSVPVSVATYTVNISAYSTIGHQYSYQNYSFSVGLWAATFTSTPPATVKNSTSYYASITLNESAILTAVNLPSWLSMSNNGSAGAHVLTGTAPKGVWNVVIMAQSVDGRLVSYLNYTLSGWDPAPLTTDQMFTIVVFLLLTFLFTILFYRDSKLGFLAGILWIITGMVALFMLSNVLTLITIIPGIYYIIGGIES